MRTTLLRRALPLVFTLPIGFCATVDPLPVQPPRLSIPAAAEQPCLLDVLPESPTQADLEIAYNNRGASILNCDGARQLAVETLLAERRLTDEWLRLQQKPRRNWWPF